MTVSKSRLMTEASRQYDVRVVDAFDVKALRNNLKAAIDAPNVSVVIVRGACAVQNKRREHPRRVDTEKCVSCGYCLKLGCGAIQVIDGQHYIDPALCAGDICGVCEQLCPQKAISV